MTRLVLLLMLLSIGCGVSRERYQNLGQETAEVRAMLNKTQQANDQLRRELAARPAAKPQEQAPDTEGAARRAELLQLRAALAACAPAQQARERIIRLNNTLREQVRPLTEAGALVVQTRDDRAVLILPAAALFEPGRAEVKSTVQDRMAGLARTLAVLPEATLQVAAHTDNQPLRRSRFRSSWELSMQRALAIVGALVRGGVDEGRLSAAGYAGGAPLASNATDEGRRQNQRIEISVQPVQNERAASPGGPAPQQP